MTREHPVAYFCAEYGVHNSLPLYSGGLGVLEYVFVKAIPRSASGKLLRRKLRIGEFEKL